MKKIFLLGLMLSLSLGAFAQNKNSNIYIAFEGGDYSYREPHMELPIHDYGTKYGVSFEWVGRRILENTGLMDEGDKSFATFEFRYITGKVTYDGYLWDGTPTKTKGIRDWYMEGRLTFGETYYLGRNFELWPYLGLGYRYLVNDGGDVDDASYRRISKYLYMPLGLKLKKDFNRGLSIMFTGEFDWFLSGEQASELGDVVYALYGIETDYVYNYQPEGWGLRFGLKIEQAMSKKFGFFVEPYYRMWKIQNSTLGTSDVSLSGNTYSWWTGLPFIEPFNITKEAGVRVGLVF